MGKTHLIEKFLRDHRSRFDEFTGVTRLPVACVQMPPSPNERDFYEELLVGLRTVLPNGLSVTALRHRTRVLARQLEGQCCKFVVEAKICVDDRQFSSTPRTDRE
jgi:hypothetical protein